MPQKKLEAPILAEGETTGHAHRLADPRVEVYEDDDGTRQFSLGQPTEVRHEEHGAVVLPPGKHVSGRVREFDAFGITRPVMD